MKRKETIPVIDCSGSGYEIGRQYGEQARKNLHKAVSLMYTSLEQMPYKAGKDAILRAALNYLDNVRAFDHDATERVKGTADGAGISFDEAFALQCYSELFVNYPALNGMCTSFAVTGSTTKGGGTILGQNVDWLPDSTIDLVRISNKDGSRRFVLVLNGYGAYHLSSYGFGNCANMTLCPPSPVVKHIPFAFYLHAAMSRKTSPEAMDVLRTTSRGVGYIHIADESGFMSGIESVYDDYALIEPKDGVLVHANHYETDKFKKTDGAAVYIQDSFGRAGRLRELIAKAYGSITPESMMEFLADHKGYPKSVCTHVDTSMSSAMPALSRASFIMVPGEGRMFISTGPPCEHDYIEYIL